MKISRRDILKFAVGSAAGALITPVPWKVLDDSAIWTQNWPWIPVPSKGESTARFTTCVLCPAGCGIRARCIAGQPVSLAGAAEHPLSGGSLCPIGLGGHHLAYHPARLMQPLRRTQKFGAAGSKPITLEEATDAIAAAIKSAAPGESVAVLDQQPGRTISLFYRRLAAQLPHGMYVRGPLVEDATLSTCAAMLGMRQASLGFDLENARTIVSFGASLFDGWGTPGRLMRLAESRRETGWPTIIQIETRQSRTALHADSWIPVKPATEGVLAMGLAHILVRDQLCDVSRLRTLAADYDGKGPSSFSGILAPFFPERVSSVTGISVERIRTLAHTIATETPAIFLGGGDPAGGPLRPEDNLAIASLNFLLGSVGREGGIVVRPSSSTVDNELQEIPVRQIQDIPDRSLRVLLLDSAESGHAIPWSLIEGKLADEQALVVSFSPYLAGISRHAEIIIPAPAFLEAWQDVPTPFHSPVSTYSLSAPLLAAPPDTVEPLETIRRIGETLGIVIDKQGLPLADHLKAHVQSLHASGKGNIFTPSDRRTAPVKDLDSSDKLWAALMEGGCWVGDRKNPERPFRFSFFRSPGTDAHRLASLAEEGITNAPTSGNDSALALMPYGWRGTAGSGQVSPLMSKVYQESGLRSISNHALVNPETGRARGMKENELATLETHAGSLQVLVHYDPSVMPGVLHVAVGPDPAAINFGTAADAGDLLSVCLAEDGNSWRVAQGKPGKKTA